MGSQEPKWDEPVYEHGREMYLLNANVTPKNGPVRVAVNGVVIWSSDDVPESVLGRQNSALAAQAQAWNEGYEEGWNDRDDGAYADSENPYLEEIEYGADA